MGMTLTPIDAFMFLTVIIFNLVIMSQGVGFFNVIYENYNF